MTPSILYSIYENCRSMQFVDVSAQQCLSASLFRYGCPWWSRGWKTSRQRPWTAPPRARSRWQDLMRRVRNTGAAGELPLDLPRPLFAKSKSVSLAAERSETPSPAYSSVGRLSAGRAAYGLISRDLSWPKWLWLVRLGNTTEDGLSLTCHHGTWSASLPECWCRGRRGSRHH